MDEANCITNLLSAIYYQMSNLLLKFPMGLTTSQSQPIVERESRSLPNELIYAICGDIPALKTPDEILLTSSNIYAYLKERISKKLIYRDVIAFIKSGLNLGDPRKSSDVLTFQSLCRRAIDLLKWIGQSEKLFEISIGQVGGSNGSEHVVIRKEQTDDKFQLSTNQFTVQVECTPTPYANAMDIWIRADNLENQHIVYFLRLVTPLVRPINWYLAQSRVPAAELAHFLATNSCYCIDWILIRVEQFLSAPIHAALHKFDKLIVSHTPHQLVEYHCALIRWLNANNNGQPKLCILGWFTELDRKVALLLLDAIKKDFAGATNNRPFVVQFALYTDSLGEFTMRNAHTGERFQFRNRRNGFCQLVRYPIAQWRKHYQLDREFEDIDTMTTILG